MTPIITQVHLPLGEVELTSEEEAQLRQLFYDALGEFVSSRGGVSGDGPAAHLKDALNYIGSRYPGMPVAEQHRKAEQVMLRKRLARKLRAAASDVSVTRNPKSYLPELLAALEARPDAVSQEQLDAMLDEEPKATPIAERTCVVLPTVFDEVPGLVEDVVEAMREHAPSPMNVYSATHVVRRCNGVIPAPFDPGRANERCSRGSGCKFEGCPALKPHD